jgi:ABC-2 type transport system ATP-binding protein
MDTITFKDVTKRFGPVMALNHLSFEIPGGRLTGFLGPNGAGKTTSFRIGLGLTRANQGEIDVFGMRVGRDGPAISKRVGAVVEDPGLHDALTARDNLRVAAYELGRGLDGVDALLDLVGLTENGSRKVGGFSKGMRQRLGVAAALIGDPDILFLDEPLDGLDPAGQVAFKAQLRQMVDVGGKTIVVSSHDLADIEELADHVIVINQGSLVVQGAKDDLLAGRARTAVSIDRPEEATQVLRDAGFDVDLENSMLVIDTGDGAHVSRLLAGAGLYPAALVPQRATLEDVFLELTDPGEQP